MVESASEPVLHFSVDLWAVSGALPTRVHQRCIAIGDWEQDHLDWGAWWRVDTRTQWLSIYWDWARGPRGRSDARLDVDPPSAGGPEMVSLHVTDHVRNYEGLDAEAVTLTFLASLNGLLAAVADRLDLARPSPIPPTRRERRWLEEGNAAPLPVGDLAKPLHDRRKEVEPLSEADFWAIMNELSGDGVQRERRLRGLLRKRTLAQVAGFHAAYVGATRELYTKALWAVVDEAAGWASDDVFTDLRCWVVAQGQETFEAVRAEPTRLHEVLAGLNPEEISDGEVLAVVADELYLDRSGRSMAADYLGIETHAPATPPS